MDKYQEFSIAADAQAMLKKAHEDGVLTAWDFMAGKIRPLTWSRLP